MMSRNWGWPRVGTGEPAAGARRRRTVSALGFEPLEGRLLLQATPTDTPTTTRPTEVPLFPTQRTVRFQGARYTIAVDGPGFVKAHPGGRGLFNVSLFGTTPQSQVTVTLTQSRPRFSDSHLPIGRLTVRSRQLGSFRALNAADLVGRMTPLRGPVNALQFNALGPAARIDVQGNLGSLDVSQGINLGPAGMVHVSGDVGTVTVGEGLSLDGGRVVFDRDVTGSITVGGDVGLSNDALLVVGRDLRGAVTAGGDVTLGAGSAIVVNRDLAALNVGGNLSTAGGGQVRVGGNLNTLAVTGVFRGANTGTTSRGPVERDLFVGLNLGLFRVLGGGLNQSGVNQVDVEVAKNIQGIDVPHGIFNSFITAGVLIDGGTQTTTEGASIGPDGPVAIFNTEIRAGVQIINLRISGDVSSDQVRNPASRRTRIVAGQDRQGTFTVGGNIDNFQITGALIDSVVVASVQPFGGDGTVMLTCGPGPGDGTYDAPAGFVGGSPTVNPNGLAPFTAPPYDPTRDPIIDDCVLPGSINRSFAPASQGGTGAGSGLPSQSTVLGGVFTTTPHPDDSDFAGLFAADTTGVFVGTLPR
jgi:hypothetical protein